MDSHKRETPKVLNKYKKHKFPWRLPREYVGRPTKWGNPFVIGRDGTREEVVAKYEKYLLENKRLFEDLKELRGKDLVCYCAPLPCHADVLLKYANQENNREQARKIEVSESGSQEVQPDSQLELPQEGQVRTYRWNPHAGTQPGEQRPVQLP